MQATQRRYWLMLPLLLAAAGSYAFAFFVRFEFTVPDSMERSFGLGLLAFVVVKGLVFWSFRLHSSRWRLVGIYDLYRMLLANLTASILACAVTVAAGPPIPISIYLADAAFCFLATAGMQVSVRAYWELFLPNASETDGTKIVLIYGAGAAGLMLAKEIRSNLSMKTRIAGYLDDDASKIGGSLLGFPILGFGAEAASIVAKLSLERKSVSEIIIAMPSATAREMRAAISHCRAARIPFKTLPSLCELLSGTITPQIREVSPNDLLGREPVRIDECRIDATIAGESVLITGGCGSIGSELCRQAARFNPRRLVIFDQAESEMFMLAMELRKRYPTLDLVTEIGDIVRAARVREVMSRHGVSVVFHAAAYKHVPLMEENITEAIENNVIGTYNVARAAHWNKVKRFVLISSDKAVNPTSIMGVTKRIAELVVSAIPLDGGLKTGVFVSVRFGNVLGSAGSVIPIFQRQIAAGGPVTVTHPDMRRYFMSISEAVQLVLQASAMGKESEVFVLDMGEPVRILELARNMIRLAGLEPDEDIEVAITGLRPGEKLFEEIQLNGENILPTPHEKIRRLRSNAPNSRNLARWLERLRMLLIESDQEALKAHLLQLVPEYQGANEVPSEWRTDRLVAARAS